MDPEGRLREAIKNGKVLTVIYHGRNPPGAVRDIVPIRITGNEVKARCLTSSTVRTFTIDKLSIINDEGRIEANRVRAPGTFMPPRYESIQDFLQKEKDFLTRLGWSIKNNGINIFLYRFFYHSKQQETPSVGMIYEAHTVDFYLDEDGKLRQELKLEEKPWAVFCEGHGVRYYPNLDKAVTKFLECAQLLAPKR